MYTFHINHLLPKDHSWFFKFCFTTWKGRQRTSSQPLKKLGELNYCIFKHSFIISICKGWGLSWGSLRCFEPAALPRNNELHPTFWARTASRCSGRTSSLQETCILDLMKWSQKNWWNRIPSGRFRSDERFRLDLSLGFLIKAEINDFQD